MKKKYFIFIALGGIAIAVLSFLLSSIESEVVQNVRWSMFAVGLTIMLVAIIALIIYCKAKSPKNLLPKGAEYQKKKSLMSAQELEFYRTLQSLVDSVHYDIIPQTALASVVDKTEGGAFRNELFRMIDFCIVDRRSYEPILLVELNDLSHKRAKRILRDDKVKAVCASAKIPLVSIDSRGYKDKRYVQQQIKKYL